MGLDERKNGIKGKIGLEKKKFDDRNTNECVKIIMCYLAICWEIQSDKEKREKNKNFNL